MEPIADPILTIELVICLEYGKTFLLPLEEKGKN
jgi:hypothetical protein